MFPRSLLIAAAVVSLSLRVCVAAAPSSQEGPKLVGTGAVIAGQGAWQGWTVAISADGNTALVGGPNDNNYTGAAWVFTRSGGVWSQQGTKLIGTGAVGGADQGSSVALSSDGNTAIVGGLGDSGALGATWVFTRSDGVWSQQGAKLIGTGAVGQTDQGTAVAVSADGNTAVVGGSFDNSSIGAVWVFTRSDGVWSQQGAKLIGTGASGSASQGFSVAVSGDGNTLIEGGPADGLYSAGASWVFTRSDGVWSQQGAKLVANDSPYPMQGVSVALSSDGNTAAVGGTNDGLSCFGAVWVYTRSDGVWSQQGSKLVGTGAVYTPVESCDGAQQGTSVALSADGNTLIEGGPYDNSFQTGAIWAFTRSDGVWSQHGDKLVGTGNNGHPDQGRAVALSADGSTAIIGGNRDHSDVGAAWVFIDPAVLAVSPPRPIGLQLAPPFPNPGTNQIAIAFSLPRDADVTLDVHDIAGRSVRTLLRGTSGAGDHTVRWDGRTSAGWAAPGGVYLVTLRAGGEHLTRRFALLR